MASRTIFFRRDREGSHILKTCRITCLLVALAPPGSGHAQFVDSVERYPSGLKPVTIECFAPAVPGRFPAVLLLHGSGGLEQATGSTFREIAATLALRGYVALIPHYFDKTDHVIGKPLQRGEYEAFMEAVNDAIEFAAKRPDVDPTQFAMIGYSMGSGLSMARAVRDPRIKAVVSVSGAYSPRPPSKKLPPLLILHGSKDRSTPVEYVKKYQEGLKEQEMPHSVHIYQGSGHNFDTARFEDATRRSIAFFDRYLRSPGRGR